MSSRAKVVFRRGWEHEMLRSTATKSLVQYHTAKLAGSVISDTPTPRKTSWTSSRNNIEAYISNSIQGWYGNVIADRNPLVNHTLLLEDGFTDRGGRRHPGRRFMKAALLKARIE